ncbi:isoflavone reductase homolog IRL-like [Triticum dicoccoides]|uniref:isoflavone reductase homolog IRL-like n=1 Tax=Triticum dicoccoides TaxID=85692 RepID=UPI001890521F|nr:isoflavone reductase homolog IRL-like [Triticum dicoccoides]
MPHTYVCCNGFAETYSPSIGDVTAIVAGPPSDKITVLGDGDAKGKAQVLLLPLLVRRASRPALICNLPNILLSLSLAVFVRGDQANFDVEPAFGVEATELYPDVEYTTVDEYLDRLL